MLKACTNVMFAWISPFLALPISEVDDLRFSRPLVMSNVFESWPELYAIRDRLAYEQFVEDGPWADEPLEKHEVSLFEDRPESISWTQTYEQRPFNLFVKPRNNIVHATMQHLRSSIPELLRNISLMGPFLSVGTRRQGNPIHSHEEAFFVQLWGSKTWFLQAPHTFGQRETGTVDQSIVKTIGPLKEASRVCEYGKHHQQRNITIDGELAHHVPEGAAIYVPEGWHHSTCNLDNWNVGFTFQGNTAPFGSFGLAIIHQDFSIVKRLYEGLSEREAHDALILLVNSEQDRGPFRQNVLDLLLDTANRWKFDAPLIHELIAIAEEEDDAPAARALSRAAETWGYRRKGYEEAEL